jgi:signal peptidase I
VEISPVPQRATRGELRRLALGILVLVPVVLLVLLPAVLGLDRFVVTDTGMDGSLGRGSVVLAREVPPTDLRVGDVISFRAPDGSEDRVTRRVMSIQDGVATTQSDRTGMPDPWKLPLTDASYDRVGLGVPWIGFPFVVDGGWVLMVVVAAGALALALTSRGRLPETQVSPSRPRLPVA